MKKMIMINTMPTTMTMTAMITRTIMIMTMIMTMIMIIINHNYKIFFVYYSRLLVLRTTQKIIRHEKEGGRPVRFWQGRANG